jgi:hypothetical protein
MVHAMDGGLWLHRHVWKGTPMWVRICTTRAEKPHCGNIAVPFM